MRQRLALAQSLLGDPRLLVLDEPANGLDPEGIRWLRGFLRHLCHDQGKTVLVSSHLLQEVEQTVDDVVIISNGTLVKQGAMADLGGGAGALVRTSDPAALADVLARALGDVGSELVEDGTLFVSSTDLQAIGDAALAAGLPVWELRRREADLEALFFELTEGRNRNLGEAVPSIGAVRSELLKYFTTRLWWGMAIGIFVSGAAFALLFGLLYTSESYLDQSGDNPFGGAPTGDATQIANSVYTAGLSVGYLLMLVIGVIQIGSEYRHRTITSTFLTQPRRPQVMLGKVLALVLVAAAYGALSLIGSVLVGAATLQARGAEAFPSAQVFRTLVLSLLVLGLWALIGLGAGILIPNQVAALLIAVGVAWIVEPIAGLAIKQWDFGREHIAPYLPSEASQAVINTALASADDVRLSWWGGAIALFVWAAAFAGVGIVRVVRQDIS